MKTTTRHSIKVDGKDIATDSEGYLLDLNDWSEDFARALAKQEGLPLTDAHWEVIRFLRAYFHEHAVQPQVRVMIRHFTKACFRIQRRRCRIPSYADSESDLEL